MVEMSGTYAGDLRCEIVHGPSGAKLVTDAPLDNEGLGRGFSPTDLAAAALGTCIVTIMGIVARRREIDIDGIRFSVTKEMVSKPMRRIGRIRTVVRLPAALGPEERAVLERAAHACPIEKSLLPELETPVEFIYV